MRVQVFVGRYVGMYARMCACVCRSAGVGAVQTGAETFSRIYDCGSACVFVCV